MSGILLSVVASAFLAQSLPDDVQFHPGKPAPAWSNLVGTDGGKHALADFKGKKAVVVVFFAPNCPDSIEYEDRLIEIARDYAGKSVGMVFLNVSLLPADDLEHMKKLAEKKKYPFPFAFDPTQKIGVAYAARTTPTVFVLNEARKVVYRGAVDDSFQEDKVEKKYLRDALDAVLAGRAVPTIETESPGCDIEYEAAATK